MRIRTLLRSWFYTRIFFSLLCSCLASATLSPLQTGDRRESASYYCQRKANPRAKEMIMVIIIIIHFFPQTGSLHFGYKCSAFIFTSEIDSNFSLSALINLSFSRIGFFKVRMFFTQIDSFKNLYPVLIRTCIYPVCLNFWYFFFFKFWSSFS